MSVRVNIEDDLHLSGRLGALAKALGVSEDTAIGRLYWAYRETQHRELCVVSVDEFCEALALRVEDPTTLLAAMVKARLVSPEGEGFVIHGNEIHIQRLQTLRGNAKSGGLARGKQMLSRRQADAKQEASKRQPSAKQMLSSSEPSQLLAPSSLLQKQDPDLCVSDSDLPPAIKFEDPPRSTRAQETGRVALEEFAEQVTGWTTPTDVQVALFSEPQPPRQPKPPKKPKPAKTVNEYSPVHQLRISYEALWEAKMGSPYLGWSPKHAARAKALVASPMALAESLQLLELFFNWPDPRVAHSYSFCEGPYSFVMQRDALRARFARPELDHKLGVMSASQRQASNEDAEKMRSESRLNGFVERFARVVTEAASNEPASKLLPSNRQAFAKQMLGVEHGRTSERSAPPPQIIKEINHNTNKDMSSLDVVK